MPASASAFCWASAPAALDHGAVEAQRRGGVDDGEEARLALQGFGVDGSGDAHDLQRVADPGAPQGVSVKGLVAQGDEGGQAIEMPGLRRQVHRLHRVAGKEVDDVERLGEAQ
jgi:hypothetical protein